MPSTTVAVGSSVGLHARPARLIADAITALDVEVTLTVNGEEPVNGGSTLFIMTLGACTATRSRSPATTRRRSTGSPPWWPRTWTPDRTRPGRCGYRASSAGTRTVTSVSVITPGTRLALAPNIWANGVAARNSADPQGPSRRRRAARPGASRRSRR